VLYKDAGVDIDAMDAVKRVIGRLCRSTYTPEVLSDVGLFGSLFKVPAMRDPVLVASCDSVGTKTAIARMMHRYDTVGVDIVNHSVNDILTLGAKPLFFLDFIAHSDMKPETIVEVVKGLGKACRANGCALVGGETAMMPDVYKPGDFELAGFIVGAVERSRVVDAKRLAPGDICVGIPSWGLHTNGYSLARRVLFRKAGLTVKSKVKGLVGTLGDALLRPHRSYLREVYPLLARVKAIAHITGGGFYDNIKRLLPFEISCIIKKQNWRPPRIFRLIQELGNVPDEEMYRTFNMGMGMVLLAAAGQVQPILRSIRGSRVIGKVVRGTYGSIVI
jgi:phosphoribosylformylglycinamidine cyclo-ligase